MATCLIMAKSKFRSVQNLKVICHHLQLTEILVVMTFNVGLCKKNSSKEFDATHAW